MIIGTFAPIPNKILCRRDLSHGAKLCCARLIQYAGKDGKAFPKLTTLADELGMSVRAVQRFISELEEADLVKIERRGRGYSNLYHVDKSIVIHIPKLDTPKVAHLDTPKVSRPDVPEVAYPYRRKENFKKEIEKIPAGLVYNMRMPR
jgi:DNA-binding transcriptional ArsR family regulator